MGVGSINRVTTLNGISIKKAYGVSPGQKEVAAITTALTK